MKKLKIGNFHVKDIRFGDKTSFNGGVLTVNKEEAVAWLMKDDRIKNVELHIAKPGESVRIVPAKAAVEPRFRPDGRCIFPGYTGPVSSCGDGVVYALKDMCVIASGKYGCQGDGLLDMSGPGARNSSSSVRTGWDVPPSSTHTRRQLRNTSPRSWDTHTAGPGNLSNVSASSSSSWYFR